MLCKECGGPSLHKKGSICKSCAGKKYYLKNRERLLAKGKEYVAKNRERVLRTHRDRLRKPEDRYKYCKYIAKKDGREFTLDFELYCAFLKEPCKYCDGPISETGFGLDRKDSSRGYTEDNVVACCTTCNRIKNSLLTHDEMRIAMDAVMRYRKTGQI